MVCSVTSKLHPSGGVADESVDAEEDDEEDVLNDDEHPEPLQVRPLLTSCVPQIQSNEATVGDDTDDGSESEGRVPTSDITNCDWLWFS